MPIMRISKNTQVFQRIKPDEDGGKDGGVIRKKVNFDDEVGEAVGSSEETTMTGSDLEEDEWTSHSSVEVDEELEEDLAMMSNEDEEPDLDQQKSASVFPKTYLVINLDPNIQLEAVTWLAKKITEKKQNGGAELLLRCEPFSSSSKEKREKIVLHVSASKLKFLEMAEQLDIKKIDSNGVLRDFNVRDLDNFLYDDINLGNLLTPSEKQLIVRHELENIRTVAGEEFLPGYSNKVPLYFGQSILQVYLQQGLISSYYPLHDQIELEKLGKKWYRAFLEAQPFEEIRTYFGDSIALYFSFLGFYTTSLFAPALLSFIQLFLPESLSSHSLIFFCIFNVVWVCIFLEVWKRKCSELAYSWGNLKLTKYEEPRSNYRGEMSVDFVTGRYQPKYPFWKTFLKTYCISLPIVFVCLLLAFWIMMYSFWIEEMILESKYKGSKFAGMITLLPSIVYAALVWLMNFYYRILATHLTEWENHRTQSQFDRHRVSKLVVFEFVNNFMSLFYIAFYIQDFEMLKSQVIVMLVLTQSINHFQEALLPLVIKKGFATMKYHLSEKWPRQFGHLSPIHRKKDNFSNGNAKNSSLDDEDIISPRKLGIKSLSPTDPRIEHSKFDGDMEIYEGTYDDYLELFIQFGYCYLFSSIYPLAAMCCVFNNFLEIRADAFKLCKLYQRPFNYRVKDIGAWQIAFEVMGIIAIMTNCALLSLSPNLRSLAPLMSTAEWIFLFVIIEHSLIGFVLALRQLIPDMPTSIKQALARLEYTSKQALKNERAFKAKRQLTRRFKTVNIGRKKTNSMKKSIGGQTQPLNEKAQLVRRARREVKISPTTIVNNQYEQIQA